MTLRVSLIVVQEADDFGHKQQNFLDAVAAQTYPREALEFIRVDVCTKASTAAEFEAFRLRHPARSDRRH